MLLFSLMLLLIGSNDGPLRMTFPASDGYWFYMGGKAMMEGLTPYVEFADSKGPLLWVVYGIGYLLNPVSLKGMFWVEVAVYWWTFWLLYLCAKLILTDGSRPSSATAALAAMLMAIPYFYPGLHSEVRAEDFCQPFYALALYGMLKILLPEAPRRIQKVGAGVRSQKLRGAVYMGLACGATTMIKYNIGVDILIPAGLIFILLMARREFSPGIRLAGGWIAGFAVTVLPFLVWFAISGNLGAFFREYFLNTAGTVQDPSFSETGDPSLWARWWFWLPRLALKFDGLGVLTKLSFLSVLLMPRRLWRQNGFGWITMIWFLLTVLIVTIVATGQYFFMLSIFWLPGICRLLMLLRRIDWSAAALSGGVALAFIALMNTKWSSGEFHDVKTAGVIMDRYGVATEIIEGVRAERGRPLTYVNWGLLDFGLHVPTGMLPGAKYWAGQVGATEEMQRDQIEEVERRKPDVVLVPEWHEEAFEILPRLGYKAVYTYQARPDWAPHEAQYTLFVSNR